MVLEPSRFDFRLHGLRDQSMSHASATQGTACERPCSYAQPIYSATLASSYLCNHINFPLRDKCHQFRHQLGPRREITIKRADRDPGRIGDRRHLHFTKTALCHQLARSIQNQGVFIRTAMPKPWFARD